MRAFVVSRRGAATEVDTNKVEIAALPGALEVLVRLAHGSCGDAAAEMTTSPSAVQLSANVAGALWQLSLNVRRSLAPALASRRAR